MKINYIDFIMKKLHVMSDEFLEKYNKFRLAPFQLKDYECKEVWEFIEKSKEEYNGI